MELYQYVIVIAILVIVAFAIMKSNKKDVNLDLNKLVDYLGGKDNIIETELEMSRFKVTLKDIGGQGVVEIDDQLKIIFSNNAKQLKKYISELK